MDCCEGDRKRDHSSWIVVKVTERGTIHHGLL